MSQPDAAFRFLSWLRRGAAAAIGTPDDPSTPGVRAALPVTVGLNQGAQQASLTLELAGPGDVIAFDARAIARVWPPANTRDAEPNLFPLLELGQPDLPWRYTPRTHDGAGRVRPWFTLIVLADAEIASAQRPTRDRSLSTVTVAAGTPMPEPDQLWAWSHVQISGDDGSALGDVLAHSPERCLARLLCPRRLDPDTHYTAMLVPTFEVGRLAGLRKPVAGVTALAPAWSTSGGTLTADVELPIYYQWSFATGDGGDFQSLVRLLVPKPLPSTAGSRALDASSPGGGLPAAAATSLMLGGALRAPTMPANPPLTVGFASAFVKLLNVPADVLDAGGDPVVAPPLYGSWHAQRSRLQPEQSPPWFQGLNARPELRVAAALGAAVVQRDQPALMASAWDQVAGIREANNRLRQAQLAREVAERLHARMIEPSADEEVLQLAAPVHGHVRVTANGTSVAALVADSPARTAMMSPAFRRIRRPLGPLGRRQGRADVAATPVIARVNDGSYAAVLPATPPAPAHLPTYSWLSSHVAVWKLPSAAEIATLPAKTVDVSAEAVGHAISGHLVAVAPAAVQPATTATIHALPVPAAVSHVHAIDSSSMARFRAASTAFANRSIAPSPGEPLRRLDLSALRTTLVAALDPAVTITAGLRAQIAAMVTFPWAPADPLTPVMAYPQFPQPMYAPLAALSPDWLLPGLGGISPNTATLAKTNPPFIEAYMVGLNHELARELLWNDYPTDQRGSYFQQFWDAAGLVPSPTPETAKDIAPLDRWPATSSLGAHSPRPVPPTGDGTFLVLVVRAEVLRRYPDTIVYAQRATLASGVYALDNVQQLPAFAARIAPDVAFFGFALADADARGDGTVGNPGWFFVFQQHPSAPKFGLAVGSPADLGTTPGNWEELSWPQLVGSGGTLAGIHYVDLATATPVTSSLEVAGGAGWHVQAAAAGKPFARGADHATITLRQPVCVALHASQMLP